MTNKKFVHAIDWFRGLAILFVVLSHIPLDDVVNNASGKAFGAFVKNGTFYFVFISGFLFDYLKNKYELKSYLSGKFHNVIVPYTFIMSVTIFCVLLVDKYFPSFIDNVINFKEPFAENGFFWHYIVGGGLIDALWYIPMAIIFFIVSPLLIKIKNNNILCILMCITLFISFSSFRPTVNVDPFYSFTHYIGVYILGMYASRKFDYIKNNDSKIMVITLIIFLLCIMFNELQVESRYGWHYGFNNIALNLIQVQKFFGCFLFLSLFCIIERFDLKIQVLDFFAKISFGIFFIHGVIIYTLRPFFTNLLLPSFVVYLIFFILVLLLSSITCLFVKKIAGKKSRSILGC